MSSCFRVDFGDLPVSESVLSQQGHSGPQRSPGASPSPAPTSSLLLRQRTRRETKHTFHVVFSLVKPTVKPVEIELLKKRFSLVML